MRIIKRDGLIPVKKIYPHPGNPRKDLGDLTELAESIKKDGIFQNLTVVLCDGCEDEEDEELHTYTAIIGHRRLAAAKLAGLTHVPCMIAEMSENEQIATMLLENMQRNDLTVYEQAQGFQMMLDIGETQDTISEKTGLSKTTIRHRLKLLELDPDEFKKSQERQPTITDYIELEKISDPKLKNEALKKIGTNDYTWAVSRAVDQEKRAKYRADWLAYFDDRAEMIEMSERSGRKTLGYYYINAALSDALKAEITAKITGEKEVYYACDKGGSLYLIGGKIDKQASTVDKKAEKAKEERATRLDKIQEIENLAHELRRDFVAKYDTIAHDDDIIEAFLTKIDFEDVNYWDAAELIKPGCEEEFDELCDLQQSEEWQDKAMFRPATLMLALMYSVFDGNIYDRLLHDWDGKYRKNESLEKWYGILKSAGYAISSTERQLLYGTHEVFKSEE